VRETPAPPPEARTVAEIVVKAKNAKLDWCLVSDEPCDLIDDLLHVCAIAESAEARLTAQQAKLAQLKAELTEALKVASRVVIGPCKRCGKDWPHPSVLSDCPVCGPCRRQAERDAEAKWDTLQAQLRALSEKWRKAPAYALTELGMRAARERVHCAEEVDTLVSVSPPPET